MKNNKKRKNQLKNRQKIKSRNAVKRDVTKTEKAIEKVRSSLKIVNIVLIIIILWSALMLSRAYVDLCESCWKPKTITFDSCYYVPRTYGARGVSFGDYYVIVDSENHEWRIAAWSDDFDEEQFLNDVQKGDSIEIRYYNWIVGKIAVTLESDSHVYQSLEDAEKHGKKDGKAVIILGLIPMPFFLIGLFLDVRYFLRYRKLKSLLALYQKRYEDYICNEDNGGEQCTPTKK
ncbi:MAG: hypothetical protein MR503_07475 [Oscillospiraceae bacterium]|nr:hypothetical protein [Oscillospiraceae bacterium]